MGRPGSGAANRTWRARPAQEARARRVEGMRPRAPSQTGARAAPAPAFRSAVRCRSTFQASRRHGWARLCRSSRRALAGVDRSPSSRGGGGCRSRCAGNFSGEPGGFPAAPRYAAFHESTRHAWTRWRRCSRRAWRESAIRRQAAEGARRSSSVCRTGRWSRSLLVAGSGSWNA
jgi:hypothetical protein